MEHEGKILGPKNINKLEFLEESDGVWWNLGILSSSFFFLYGASARFKASSRNREKRLLSSSCLSVYSYVWNYSALS